MPHNYNLRSKKNGSTLIECMDKAQLCTFIILTLKGLEKPSADQQNKDILDLFYAVTTLVENYDANRKLSATVLVKLNHAITLDRFSSGEKAKLTDYFKRIQKAAFE